MSPRMCLDDMTSYAPPYAFRVMTVILGNVDERQERDVQGVAEPDEARALDRRADVETTRENGGLVGRDPDGPPVHPGEADDDVPRVMLLDLVEVSVVDDLPDHLPNVVRF